MNDQSQGYQSSGAPEMEPAQDEYTIAAPPSEEVFKQQSYQGSAPGPSDPNAATGFGNTPEEEMAPTFEEVSTLGFDPELMGILVYLFGFISAIFFLVAEKKNSYIRFHAWQSLAMFLPLTVLTLILFAIFSPLGMLMWFLSAVLWVFAMYQGHKGAVTEGEKFYFPLVGQFADERLRRESFFPHYGNYYNRGSPNETL